MMNMFKVTNCDLKEKKQAKINIYCTNLRSQIVTSI